MDAEDEDFDNELKIIVEAVTGILEILGETQSPIQALEIMSATTAFILCNGMSSAKEADEFQRIFVNKLGEAVHKAEQLGATMWTRGTSH